MGGAYTLQGDYYLPNLTLPAEENKIIGIWGQRHLRYIRQHRKVFYTNLLTSGRLNGYLADIDRQATGYPQKDIFQCCFYTVNCINW